MRRNAPSSTRPSLSRMPAIPHMVVRIVQYNSPHADLRGTVPAAGAVPPAARADPRRGRALRRRGGRHGRRHRLAGQAGHGRDLRPARSLHAQAHPPGRGRRLRGEGRGQLPPVVPHGLGGAAGGRATLRRDLYLHIQGMPLAFFSGTHSGRADVADAERRERGWPACRRRCSSSSCATREPSWPWSR